MKRSRSVDRDWYRLTRITDRHPEFAITLALLAFGAPLAASITFHRGQVGLGLLSLLGIIVVLGMVRFCSRRLFLMYLMFLAVSGLAWGVFAVVWLLRNA